MWCLVCVVWCVVSGLGVGGQTVGQGRHGTAAGYEAAPYERARERESERARESESERERERASKRESERETYREI